MDLSKSEPGTTGGQHPVLVGRGMDVGSYSPGREPGFPTAGTPTPGSDLKRYGQILRHRWKTVVAVFVITVLGVAVGTYLQTPVYRASGTLELRQQTADVASVEGLYEPQNISIRHLETQYGLLRSPALARRVIADLSLADAPTANAGRSSSVKSSQEPGQRSAKEIDRAVAKLRQGLTVDPVTGSNLVKVSFESEDPDYARRVLSSVFTNYVAMRVEAGRAAERRLSEQVDSVRAELARAEQKLQEYAQANGLLFVEGGGGNTENIAHERLRNLQQQLTAAEAERYAKESDYNTVRGQGTGDLDSEVTRSLSVRAADLRSEYAKLSSTFTDDYPRTQQVKSQLEAVEALLARERARVARETRNGFVAARQRQELLQQAFRDQQQAVEGLAARAAEYRVLQRDVEGHQQLYTTLQQKEKAAGVSAALAATEVHVVDPPTATEQPIRPVPRRNLQLAMLVGLMLGVGLAFVQEYATPPTLNFENANTFPDVPILGAVPSARSLDNRISALGDGGRTQMLARWSSARPDPWEDRWYRIDGEDPRSAALADAFGSLRTSVLFDLSASATRSLLITSGQPREGKTTVSVNLSISLAKLEKRVLLIDADIRRPSVHRVFDVDGAIGLADYLEGRVERQAVMDSSSRGRARHRSRSAKSSAPARRVVSFRDVVPGLDVLAAGQSPVSPAELLSSPRMEELMREAEETYDFVVVDSPALLINAADARILAPLVDGVILVVRDGTTPRDHLTRMLKQARNIMGVVVNDLDAHHFPEYYRAYSTAEDTGMAGFNGSGRVG